MPLQCTQQQSILGSQWNEWIKCQYQQIQTSQYYIYVSKSSQASAGIPEFWLTSSSGGGDQKFQKIGIKKNQEKPIEKGEKLLKT